MSSKLATSASDVACVGFCLDEFCHEFATHSVGPMISLSPKAAGCCALLVGGHGGPKGSLGERKEWCCRDVRRGKVPDDDAPWRALLHGRRHGELHTEVASCVRC